MSFTTYKTLVVSGDIKAITKVREKALSLRRRYDYDHFDIFPVSEISPRTVNHDFSFVVFPDGSKEGWEPSIDAAILRRELVDYIRTTEPSVYWAEMHMGEGCDCAVATLADHFIKSADGSHEDNLKQLMTEGFEISVVAMRYGSGYAGVLGRNSETVAVLASAVTGGDSDNECLCHLEDGWYPYVVGADIETTLTLLRAKINREVEANGYGIYSRACDVAGSMLMTDSGLPVVYKWATDPTAFVDHWENE